MAMRMTDLLLIGRGECSDSFATAPVHLHPPFLPHFGFGIGFHRCFIRYDEDEDELAVEGDQQQQVRRW